VRAGRGAVGNPEPLEAGVVRSVEKDLVAENSEIDGMETAVGGGRVGAAYGKRFCARPRAV
jgi:hypothetical protein